MVVLMLSGIGLITGQTFKLFEPLTAWATHRALGIAFSIALFIHIFALLFDKFVPMNIIQVLVPFTSTYLPITIWGIHFGTLWTAFGIVAMYMTFIIVATSLLWIEKKPYLWRFIHFFSYAVLALVFFHGLFMGTDLSHGSFRFLWIAMGVGVIAYIVVRLKRAGTTKAQ